MKRPVNSRIGHGHPSCGRYGCKREECREAFRHYKRENHRERKAGFQATVPADSALEHVRKLLIADMPPKDIEAISGVDETVIVRMLRGDQSRIHWTTEEALLGVSAPEGGWAPRSDGMIPSVGAMRRLQALGVQGYSPSVLAEESGLDIKTIRMIQSGSRSKILISRNRAIRWLHDRLWDTDPLALGLRTGDVTRTRQHAQNQGWYPTEAWVDIDDPQCEPTLGTPRYVALTEDARELMKTQGYTRSQAAERLGVEYDTLKAAILYYEKAKERVS